MYSSNFIDTNILYLIVGNIRLYSEKVGYLFIFAKGLPIHYTYTNFTAMHINIDSFVLMYIGMYNLKAFPSFKEHNFVLLKLNLCE